MAGPTPAICGVSAILSASAGLGRMGNSHRQAPQCLVSIGIPYTGTSVTHSPSFGCGIGHIFKSVS